MTAVVRTLQRVCRRCSIPIEAEFKRGAGNICRPCMATERRERRVAPARAIVAEVNARTACAHCGAQPIEWHNPEHVEMGRQLHRISKMVSRGQSIAAIKAELARCTPLCRRCHMVEDGRLATLVERGRAPKPTKPASPCSECDRLYKPLRLGRCATCYERLRPRYGRSEGRYGEVAS